ncbi:transcriptional regulator [Enterobacter sp. CGMCC 5087]|uniref:Cro/CI family transcriptional regulator n=1 Tax=Enterobacter sp. CGMCC 5087 TaxID=2183878 RepID=UPI000D67DE5B|nr:Cro/CI family transcriptional regulator [Enterobacter sp. CGMCC 5087]PWI80322.1 transcriptional regulator [Enterobacter sp. CGMCC 5087]
MLKIDAVNFFGSNTRTAIAAGVERSAVSQWKELVPERCAQRLADASDGSLIYDKNVYDQHRKAKRASKKNTASLHKESD